MYAGRLEALNKPVFDYANTRHNCPIGSARPPQGAPRNGTGALAAKEGPPLDARIPWLK